MLNGKGNENGIKINRSNQQKKLHVQHMFFLISKKKKTNLHVKNAFCLSLPTVQKRLSTKTSNFIVTLYFYGGIVVCAYPIFCLLCSCSLLFFTAAHFHLAGRQHFSLTHSRFEFSCFCSYKIRFFCFQSLACFFFPNVPTAMRFLPNKTLSCIWVAIHVD